MNSINNRGKIFTIIMFILTIVVIISLLEGVSRVYLSHLENSNYISTGMYQFDKILGWRLNDGIYSQKHLDFKANYTISDGKRLTINNACTNSHRTINLFGDSFTFGIGVEDHETIASLLSKEAKEYCVNNYGISGYGPDQYKLLYDMKANGDDINIFIILTGNDYTDINSKTDQAGVRHKPLLVLENNHYRWDFPEPDEKDHNNIANIKQNRFSSKFLALLRSSLRKSSFIVKLRNALPPV